jgi:DnaJ-class molecular chaperone
MAYKVLMDAGKREEYDRQLGDAGHGHSRGVKKSDSV